MSQPVVFDEILEAAERLDDDAQAELIAILERRRLERRREQIAEDVAQVRREFAAGLCKPMTASEIMRDALS